MNSNWNYLIVTAALLFSGCSSKLIFTTRTSAGLDVSGTAEVPNRVSFTYNRQELSMVPRKTNGEAHSVYGGLDSDIGFWSGSVIKQTFATGHAAELASGGPASLEHRSQKTDEAPLVFCTATTFGLHLSAGDGQFQPNLLMGYRRVEGAYIPVPDPAQEVRPVFADILINTKAPTNKNGSASAAKSITTNFPSSAAGVRIKQSFATGKAAIYLARDSGVQSKLNEAAGTADGALRVLERRGNDLHQEIILEVSKLQESQLDQAANALKSSGLVEEISGFARQTSFEKSRLLRDIAKDLRSEEDIKKLEAYVVELRKLTQEHP